MPHFAPSNVPPEREVASVQGKLHNLAVETDTQFVREIVKEFLTEAPQALFQMQEKLIQHDFETAGRTAHSLKSNCATFGLFRLAGALQQFETNCNGKQKGAAQDHLKDIQATYPISSHVLAKVADSLS